jgi:argininosuccinate lyase
VPFRETHHISGRAVAKAEELGVQISDLSFEQYRELSDQFTEDVRDVFDMETSVEKKNVIGGPYRKGIATQVEYITGRLANL